MVSASAIACTGTVVDTAGNDLPAHSIVPYEDLEFSWDFGDSSGTEIFTNPRVGGTTANANSSQTGPEAAYCYRSAGTYTVTLTIRGKNGTGFTATTSTQSITVSTFNPSGGTYYFDSVDGNDANDGLSAGAPKQSISALNTVLQTTDRQIYFKRGSHWSGATGILSNFLGGQRYRIAPYGTGADPIVEVTSGTDPCFYMNIAGSGNYSKQDIVISNVKFMRGGSKTGYIVSVLLSNLDSFIKDVYFDNCHFESNNSSGAGGMWVAAQTLVKDATVQGFGIWGGSITATATDTARNIGFYGGLYQWNFYVGFSINGTGSDAVLDHHIYPDSRYHNLFRWIDFGDGPARNYCINGNWDVSVAHDQAGYWLFSDLNITGTKFAIDQSSGSGVGVDIVNSVVQNCDIHDLATGGNLFYGTKSATFRDNHFYNNPNRDHEEGQAAISPLNRLSRIYRNFYYSETITSDYTVRLLDPTSVGPRQITDNIIYTFASDARTIGLKSAQEIAAGAFIDRNQYWFPNDVHNPVTAWDDNGTHITFAQWQAFGFDVNGLIAEPDWTDPANGVFSASALTPEIEIDQINPGGTIIPYGKRISRKRFREIMEAIEAQRAAETRAERIKSRPARRALAKASHFAELAIAEAKAAQEALDLSRMIAALDAATRASDLAETIRQADLAVKYAQQAMDDEDEAVALLMLN